MTSFPGNLHCTMCNLIQYVLKSTIVFDNSCNNLLFSPIDCLYSILGYFLYLVFLLFHLVPILSKYITHHWYFYWFPFQRIAYCITPEHEHHLVAEGNIRQFKVGPFLKKNCLWSPVRKQQDHYSMTQNGKQSRNGDSQREPTLMNTY